MTRLFGRLFVISALGLGLTVALADPSHAQRMRIKTKDCCSACQFTRVIKVRGQPVTVPVRPPRCVDPTRVPVTSFCPFFKIPCS